MAIFEYKGKDAKGEATTGTVKANSALEASKKLEKKRILVSSVRELKDGKKKMPPVRIKGEDMVIFTRQMSTMISSGIPLIESLEIMGDQAEDKGFKAVIFDVIEQVRSGNDLSESMRSHPKVFERIYVNMIKAGEMSGQLDIVMVRLAEYQEAAAKLRGEIKSAMTYPVISLVLILGITLFLMTVIVPQFAKIFTDLGAELPTITQMIMDVSNSLTDQWYLYIGAIVGLIVAIKIAKKTKGGRHYWDLLMFKLPIFGQLFQKVNMSRFSRTFGTLLKSGVPILGALEIVATTSGNSLVEDAIMAARENVKQGNQLAPPLAESGVFPLMVTRMMAVGEKTGALEQLLEKISEFYDQQVDAAVKSLTSMIEPIMISMMGGIVGFIVVAIFLPIFKAPQAMAG